MRRQVEGPRNLPDKESKFSREKVGTGLVIGPGV
jgi:hypothetical protein